MKNVGTTKATATTALALIFFAFAPTGVVAADLPDACEATPEAPSCEFACRQGTLIEMVVYGPGRTEDDGRSWTSMQTTCGGSGPVANSGYVSTKQIWCDTTPHPADPVWNMVQPGCTTYLESVFNGHGTCRLDTGSRATCRSLPA